MLIGVLTRINQDDKTFKTSKISWQAGGFRRFPVGPGMDRRVYASTAKHYSMLGGRPWLGRNRLLRAPAFEDTCAG